MTTLKTILVILDGFGLGPSDYHSNAIAAASTPFFDKWINSKTCAKLKASEQYVGLKPNQFGNSELGHMTIGSGRTIYGTGEYAYKLIVENQFSNYLLNLNWIKSMLESKQPIHLIGIYSKGCVHGDLYNFDAMINFLKDYDVQVCLDLISDGRDTSKYEFLNDLKSLINRLPSNAKITSISGRYYAMDRDKKFHLTNQAYDAIQQQIPVNCDPITYLQNEYDQGYDDEFIHPASFGSHSDAIVNHQYLCFLNYRSDRIRQLIHKFRLTSLYNPNEYMNHHINLVCINDHPGINADYLLFTKPEINNTLNDVFIKNKLDQLRVAESEKYAHVTFFFDCGVEGQKSIYKNQILIPSPQVATYDLKPEMSAKQITETIINNYDKYDLIVVNYANADMVGHTGNFIQTKKAIECLDNQMSLLYDYIVNKNHGNLIITSDHGNADCMLKDDKIIKTHTIAEVPLILCSEHFKLNCFHGSLQDIAPSILYMYGLSKPSEMEGKNLFTKIN